MATGRVPTTANSPLTAKGDLFGYSTTQARVPVGSDGETLVADSSASTGLRWQPVQSATNYLVNSLFDFWQRGTSSTVSGFGTADRWYQVINAGAGTFSQSTASPLPAGGRYFMRVTASANSSNFQILQALESSVVIPLRGKTMTVSGYVRGSFTGNVFFDIKYSNSTDALTSQTSSVGSQTSFAVTSSWVRTSYTFTVPSDAVGLRIDFGNSGTPVNNTQTLDIFGIQLEEGSVATPLVRAGGTLAGELAACQRYYFRIGGDSQSYQYFGVGNATSTTNISLTINQMVKMRTSPSSVDFSNLAWTATGGLNAITAVSIDIPSTTITQLNCTTTGATSGTFVKVLGNNNTAAFIALSAEL